MSSGRVFHIVLPLYFIDLYAFSGPVLQLAFELVLETFLSRLFIRVSVCSLATATTRGLRIEQ